MEQEGLKYVQSENQKDIVEKKWDKAIIKGIKTNNFTELWKHKTSDPRNSPIALNNK